MAIAPTATNVLHPAETSVTIVGAGIVGLSLALQLHASGFRKIQIFEKVRNLEPLGVGISIQAGAALVYRNLGLQDAMDNISISCKQTVMHNEFGNYIHSLPMGEAAGSKVRTWMVHRGKLQMMLYDAVKERLGQDCIHLDHAIHHFEESADKITAHFTSRVQSASNIERHESDVLVGADGINSTVRSHLYPDEGPPLFGGMSIWRGAFWTSVPQQQRDILHFQGYSDQWFMSYPISRPTEDGKTLLNWGAVVRTRPRDDPDKTPPKVVSWNQTAPKDEIIHKYDGWDYGDVSVRNVIESSDPIWVYPMVDRDPVSRWSFGRLTLIGDAAHPMYPLGGNGASQGVLDVASLTKQLQQGADVPSALKAYEAERLEATAAIVRANRGDKGIHTIGDIVHERAPHGFTNVKDVISDAEINEIASGYYKATGNHASIVNQQAVETEGTAERLGLKSPRAWVAA